MGTADSDEMAPETPQPTHVDVHIHQESALAKLLLTCCSALRPLATQARGSSRLLVTSWVMQIVLGILSGVLGGFLYMRGFTLLVSSGAAIWTGAVAVLAGVAAFIYETRRGTYWSLLRSVLDLAAFCTAVAALKLWNADLGYNNYYSSMCNISTSSYWYNTPAPTKSPEEVRRLQLCISLLDMLEAGPVHYPSGHALGCLDSVASGIPGPSGAVLLEDILRQKEKRQEGDVRSEWNLAVALPIITPGAPALGVPASDCWKKNQTGKKRLFNSPSYPAPRTTATALL
ncbi:transmembrane protein 176A isoform X1 [Callithrix jacchus]